MKTKANVVDLKLAKFEVADYPVEISRPRMEEQKSEPPLRAIELWRPPRWRWLDKNRRWHRYPGLFGLHLTKGMPVQ